MNGSTTGRNEHRLAETDHHRGTDWLAQHPGSLTDYVGQWVALDENGIVAHSPSAVEVVRLARERGVDDPLLVPVMPPRFGID
jgi:Family of unknown function (DUF5678)